MGSTSVLSLSRRKPESAFDMERAEYLLLLQLALQLRNSETAFFLADEPGRSNRALGLGNIASHE